MSDLNVPGPGRSIPRSNGKRSGLTASLGIHIDDHYKTNNIEIAYKARLARPGCKAKIDQIGTVGQMGQIVQKGKAPRLKRP